MKKILILEDNEAARKHIQTIINELNDDYVVFSCTDVKEAYRICIERRVDLFIIDIILDTNTPGDTSGLRFVESIRKIDYYSFSPVIFVTSLEDSRLYTYEKLHCYSFVEKPFDSEKLKKTLAKCLKFPGESEKERTLFFRKDGIVLSVDSVDIVYVESINHRLDIHVVAGDILQITYITLQKLLEEAENKDLMQCSRNAIVNKKFVENIDFTNRVIKLKNKYGSIALGFSFKKRIKEVFTSEC